MLKRIITLSFISSLILVGCKDKNTTEKITEEVIEQTETTLDSEFKVVDQIEIDNLNAKVIDEKLDSEEAILKAYSPESEETEGNYSYEIKTIESKDGKMVLELIEDGIQDDSVKSVKVIMTIEKENDLLKVTEIKKSFKCWQGRGHQEWSAEICS